MDVVIIHMLSSWMLLSSHGRCYHECCDHTYVVIMDVDE